MSDTRSIILAGVGGQGILLTGKILTAGLMGAGFDVKMSEVHGMAQRGGSVTAQVRYGKKVYSPIVGKGGGDVLVAFEKMEAVRYASFLKPDGIIVVNDYETAPMPVASGNMEYPKGILEALGAACRTVTVCAAKKALEAGNLRTQNIVMLGALVRAFSLEALDWETIIRQKVPQKFADVNVAAFRAGMEEGQAL